MFVFASRTAFRCPSAFKRSYSLVLTFGRKLTFFLNYAIFPFLQGYPWTLANVWQKNQDLPRRHPKVLQELFWKAPYQKLWISKSPVDWVCQTFQDVKPRDKKGLLLKVDWHPGKTKSRESTTVISRRKIDCFKIVPSSLSCRYSRLFYPPFGSFINESNCLLLILGACGRGQ